MALFKSKFEKIKALMEDLTDEEKVELKKLIDGEDVEVEEDEVVETETETEEAPAGDDEVEKEEDAIEETPAEEGAEEENADETPEATDEDAPSEEAPVEEEAPTDEIPEPVDEQPTEPVVDEKDEKIKALEVQVIALQDSINNLLAKVEPIVAQFEDVNNIEEEAGLGQPNSVTADEYEGMTAHELAMKLARY